MEISFSGNPHLSTKWLFPGCPGFPHWARSLLLPVHEASQSCTILSLATTLDVISHFLSLPTLSHPHSALCFLPSDPCLPLVSSGSPIPSQRNALMFLCVNPFMQSDRNIFREFINVSGIVLSIENIVANNINKCLLMGLTFCWGTNKK